MGYAVVINKIYFMHGKKYESPRMCAAHCPREWAEKETESTASKL